MGRSATLCKSQSAAPTTLEWDVILSHRAHLNENLALYLKEKACVEGAPVSAREEGTYLDELSSAYVSIVKQELVNFLEEAEKTEAGVRSTISFAVIYTELWRQATIVEPSYAGATNPEVWWIEQTSNDSSVLIDIERLRDLNSKWGKWSSPSSESDDFVTLASNLSDSYLKAMAECHAAASSSDTIVIRHHMALLGDILQEMLELHATLLPSRGAGLPND